MWHSIEQQIAAALNQDLGKTQRQSVGGGSINQAYWLKGVRSQVFVKLNQASQLSMFEAELAGLTAMQATQTIRVPQPICCGIAESYAFIAMEAIPLSRQNTPQAWYQMGCNLALLHQAPQAIPELKPDTKRFGWHRDNTIGSTSQPNPWTEHWLDFWAEHRLGYQFHLARRQGVQFARATNLMAHLPRLLNDHHPCPSLVHGDLWTGNAALSQTGEPVIFDPATYWGDREVDIAMSRLFGSFPATFYQGYQATYPLPLGYERRQTLYNLYHILNHVNLFGGSYAAQAQNMIDQILG
jgi:fructosamine-3-kinase